jgi:hypothetical protein
MRRRKNTARLKLTASNDLLSDALEFEIRLTSMQRATKDLVLLISACTMGP